MNDESIIDLYWQRSEQAIAETQTKYGPMCMSISMNILGSSADAEECVNDTYLWTWNHIPPKRPPSLRAFLARITRHLSIDRYRERHAACRNEDMTVALDELAACLPAPEEAGEGLMPLLETFLRARDDLDRQLFMGRYWHAYPVKELARYYALTPNAVTKRLIRTRERLRVYLTERGYHI